MLIPLPELLASIRTELRCLDAETAMKEQQKSSGTVIDVREPGELENCRPPLSINIPRGILEMKVMGLLPDANHPIYLHCASGGRATLAAEQLLRLGYKRVSVITCTAEIVLQHQQPKP